MGVKEKKTYSTKTQIKLRPIYIKFIAPKF